MESGRHSDTESRAILRNEWLLQNGYAQPPLPMAGDASTRSYFRLTDADTSYVLMDGPPHDNDCRQFARIADALRSQGLQTPRILAADYDHGWLLITDFGEQTYLKALNENNADRLYHYAIDALVKMQSSKALNALDLNPFGAEWMQREWLWHKEWFLQGYLGISQHLLIPDLDECMRLIIESAINQPQVFMYRDYHAGNLMLLENEVGLLDFQDAFIGPVSYDLASLLRDCYIVWPEETMNRWLSDYYQMQKQHDVLKGADLATLRRWFDWMCVQRHLKAIMTFSRKHLRDNQSNYLQHIPAALNYIMNVSAKYPELQKLYQFVSKVVEPALNKKKGIACEQ